MINIGLSKTDSQFLSLMVNWCPKWRFDVIDWRYELGIDGQLYFIVLRRWLQWTVDNGGYMVWFVISIMQCWLLWSKPKQKVEIVRKNILRKFSFFHRHFRIQSCLSSYSSPSICDNHVEAWIKRKVYGWPKSTCQSLLNSLVFYSEALYPELPPFEGPRTKDNSQEDYSISLMIDVTSCNSILSNPVGVINYVHWHFKELLLFSQKLKCDL